MDKTQFIEILQSALLYFEGTEREELFCLIDKENATIGIKLTEFLTERLGVKE